MKMARSLHCAGALTLMLTWPLAAAQGQQPERDRTQAAPAAGVVSGIVVSGDVPARPQRRAVVTLTGSGPASGSAVVTDDQGRFLFSGLPAGRYDLTASKPGFVTGAYGAKRPGRGGTPVVLMNDQRVNLAPIVMARGAVIAGTVRDARGEPVQGVRVHVMREGYSPQNGERMLLAVSAPGGETDDRGMYRIYGLLPGEYFAALDPPFALPGDLRQVTEQSMQTALQQVHAPPGGAGPTPFGPTPQSGRAGPSVGYATIFYPGTSSAADASAITLEAGEARVDIDMPLRLVPTASIEGVVVDANGQPAPSAQLSLVANGLPAGTASIIMSLLSAGLTRPHADGSFTIAGIPPGQYTLAARTRGAGAFGGPLPGTPVAWATADLSIDGADVAGVRLSLQPGMTISGRVAFEGASPPPIDLAHFRVLLSPVLSGGAVAIVPPPQQTDAQGRFTFKDVMPGRYRLAAEATGPSSAASAWTLASAAIDGREAFNASIDIAGGASTMDAVLTFTDRPAELSGVLQDTTG